VVFGNRPSRVLQPLCPARVSDKTSRRSAQRLQSLRLIESNFFFPFSLPPSLAEPSLSLSLSLSLFIYKKHRANQDEDQNIPGAAPGVKDTAKQQKPTKLISNNSNFPREERIISWISETFPRKMTFSFITNSNKGKLEK